jgi:hypothetical protein
MSMVLEPLRDDLMVQQQLPAGTHVRGGRDISTIGAWQHMVAVIMLNQTGRKPVKWVLPKFLHLWPTPLSLLRAQKDTVKNVIWPLGLVNVRYKRLNLMSRDFLTWDFHDARDLYGIGKYGSDSYEIFFKHNYSVEPTDKELRRYLADLDSTHQPLVSDPIMEAST